MIVEAVMVAAALQAFGGPSHGSALSVLRDETKAERAHGAAPTDPCEEREIASSTLTLREAAYEEPIQGETGRWRH
jgi:hypothetical protein